MNSFQFLNFKMSQIGFKKSKLDFFFGNSREYDVIILKEGLIFVKYSVLANF